MRLPAAAFVAAALALTLACSRGNAGEDKRLRSHAEKAPPVPFDWDHPAAALDLGPEDVAARLGAFEWTAAIEWTVSRDGDDARRVRAVERHRVRQAAAGDFEVQVEIDPGLGPGSDTGRDIVYARGMTYARGRYAPFRERPTDRGRDARRYRDESFFTPRTVARLLGPALELDPIGDAEALRRPARKLAISLAKGMPSTARAAGVLATTASSDQDTKRRHAFLEGLRAQTASGELLLDRASGAPLSVRISATFSVEGDPSSHATMELLAQVKTLGADVGGITPPAGALPDERKAAGVAAALEAAGLKKGPEKKGQPEPAEEGGEE